MKSVYMGNPPVVKRVYACAEALLKAEANCAGYLTREDVLAGKAMDVDYIFSTWGMPQFDEEEIRTCEVFTKHLMDWLADIGVEVHWIDEIDIRVFL